MTQDVSSVISQLKSAREQLHPLNRTVTHRICLASDESNLVCPSRSQHGRQVSCTWGVREDVYFWDSWDRKVRGEDDLRRFFEIAERIGGMLDGLELTAAAELLPGTVHEILGRWNDLFLPDYWLFVVHHLGWTRQLPYECEMRWREGTTFDDERFSMTSHLPVNIVQASIDALTVLIDESPDSVGVLGSGDAPGGPSANRGAVVLESSRAVVEVAKQRAAAGIPAARPPLPVRPARKRAERAANIEALKRELAEVVRAQRDHAQAATDFGREPVLLPRPSRKELGERIGLMESAVSRCFNDPAATELNLLWDTAADLNAVLRFVR